ncbi:ABC transporter ATP-binding protein [Lampropedia puyangensis]|uniref:ABC transporter ATP-binding protein n=1 Tax=Lampropedia puyangensis TaxID=1330072 RepID=A0A4S8F0S0_9BURK|nr:ABC transporter ATP-binding protein [Lampropedia puyangensis]THU00241.1 ABC transporter ATP-binding protein [Lampropedia puyangensis]
MVAVELKNVSKSYDGKTFAIEGLNLQCEYGEMLALLGPSGCGKSTTLKLIAGIERISGGQIMFGARDVSQLDTASRNVAMVFEDYALYPHLSVFENIAFPLRVRSTLHSDIDRAVGRVIDLLELQEVRDANVRKLSGGAQQRVSIGRALVREPDLIMFDEPLSHMDAAQKVGLRSEIARLQKAAKLTSVLVTHDQTEAISMADRIAVMDKGVLQQVATPAEIYARPANLFVASFIGEPPMNLLEAQLLEVRSEGVAIAIGQGVELLLPLQPYGAAIHRASSNKLVVGVRPEHVRLAQKNGHHALVMTTPIVVVETRGDHDVLQLRSPMGRLVMEVNGPSGFAQGQLVNVAIDPHDVHVFDAQTTCNLLAGVTGVVTRGAQT